MVVQKYSPVVHRLNLLSSLQGLRKIRRLSKREHAFRVGNSAKVWTKAVGEMTLCFDLDRILVLKNVLYVLVFKQNLISISKLVDHSYSVSFHSSVTINRKLNFICSGNLYGNLFHLNHVSHQINNTKVELINKKRNIMANDSYL
jgi:hypothetical protein